MVQPATRTQLLGFGVAVAVAVLLLLVLFPAFGRRIAGRDLPVYFVTVALVPVILWLFPTFVRALARLTYLVHRAIAGRGGFYVRVPKPRTTRFRDTLVFAVGPFAIDLFVLSEILYFFGPADVKDLRFSLLAFSAVVASRRHPDLARSRGLASRRPRGPSGEPAARR